jgi:hypothetical protein
MSQKGQKQTYAPQQLSPLFDLLVGGGEQRWRRDAMTSPGSSVAIRFDHSQCSPS